MSVSVTIICDACSAVIDAAETAAQARASVRSIGGRVNLPGGRDLCPFCVADGKSAEHQASRRSRLRSS